jgi:hypothetical protein
MFASWNWKPSQRTMVSSKPTKAVFFLLCLLVFGLTALVTYWKGCRNNASAGLSAIYTATVEVVQRSPVSAEAGQNAAESGREVRTPFTDAYATSDQASQEAKAQADRFVAEQRERWKQQTEEACRQARQNAKDAHQAQVDAEAELTAFRKQLEASVQAAANAKANGDASATVENPDWRETQVQLASLQQQRDQLLVDRTPLHPAVKEVAAKIAMLQSEIAKIPQRIPARQAASHESDADLKSPAVDRAGNALRMDEVASSDSKKLEELTSAVEQARAKCAEMDAAERLAIEAGQKEPVFDVAAATIVKTLPKSDFQRRRLRTTAWAAGLLMACGFGSFLWGIWILPPVVNAAQLEADLDMAILGVVPSQEPVNIAAVCLRRSCCRYLFIVVGMVLMGVCPLVAILGIQGL